MKPLNQTPVGRQVMLVVMATCGGALVVAAAIQFWFQVSTFRAGFVSDLEVLAGIVARSSTAAVDFDDRESAAEILAALQARPFIIHASIRLSNGAILASHGAPVSALALAGAPANGHRMDGPHLIVVRPIPSRERAATLYLWADYRQVLGSLSRLYAGVVALSLAVSFGLAFLVSTRLQRLISAPLQRLASTAQKVALQGDYAVRAEPASGPELADLTRAFNQMLDRIEEQRAALQTAQERFSKAFDASPMAVSLIRLPDRCVVDVNQAFLALFDLDRAQACGASLAGLPLWESPGQCEEILALITRRPGARDLEARLRTREGAPLETLLQIQPIELDGVPFLLWVWENVTQRRALESQLRQAQKMEAVGQLAAGVAHDFNNLLTVIEGHGSILLDPDRPPSPEQEEVAQMVAAGRRAAGLVRQLLTFSRKQAIRPAPLRLDHVLREFQPMIERVLTERVALHVDTAPDLPCVLADQSMIEQVLMNLAVNARDAMPEGGHLFVHTDTLCRPEPASGSPPHARPGHFVRLTVADTGCGMDPEILRHAFEPFYTTKAPGKGTGLGLATVYGIVQQHNGWIEVQSQPGRGARFLIHIPVTDAPLPPPAPSGPPPGARGAGQTILVVEDEGGVRRLIVNILRRHGYSTLEAADGPAALQLWERESSRVSLVITDMVMPGGFSGRQLAQRLSAARPGLKTLFITGYSTEIAGQDSAWIEGADYLSKPFQSAALLAAVRSRLAG